MSHLNSRITFHGVIFHNKSAIFPIQKISYETGGCPSALTILSESLKFVVPNKGRTGIVVNVNAIIRRHISHVKECSSGIQYEHTFAKHEYPDAVTWLLETQHFYFRLLDIPMSVIDRSFTSNRSFAPSQTLHLK